MFQPVDIVERFQIFIFLLIIGLRNLSENFIGSSSIKSLFELVLCPLILVYCSEITVDWLKHAFITKFNQIKPSVYSDFLNALSKHHTKPDIDPSAKSSKANDPSTKKYQSAGNFMDISRKIGFSSIPLSCLVMHF
jgi:hypothetical protein